MKFTVVLHSDDGQYYGVCVPDLKGCFSGGDSLEDALESVREAIELHLECGSDEGKAIPDRLPIAHHQANPDYAGGIWAVVDVDTTAFEGGVEQISVTLPKTLLKRIDDYAMARHSTRSVFLAEAARVAMR